jgi:hypothetical protein
MKNINKYLKVFGKPKNKYSSKRTLLKSNSHKNIKVKKHFGSKQKIFKVKDEKFFGKKPKYSELFFWMFLHYFYL